MLADYHVHSVFSDDSVYAVDDICADAIRLNLDEVCFTDHVDYGIKPDIDHPELAPVVDGQPALNVDYGRYFPALAAAGERYAADLTVRRGLELGVQSHTVGRYEELVARWGTQMDFAILSIHQVEDAEFWTGDFQRGRTQREYNDAYYAEMLRVVERFGGYSVLGHLDLIKRYDPAGPYPFERVRDIIAEILRRVIADGKGIELNTSGIRYGLGDLQPSADILALYRDLGGRIVTVGSDSHKPEHLGSYLALAKRRLASLGFTEYCTFRGWEPVFHPIDD